MNARAVSLCVALAVAGARMKIQAAGFADAEVLRSVQHAARTANEAGIAPLKSLHDAKAAEMVLSLIAEKRVPDSVKQRLAETVAQWPAKDGQDYFVRYAKQQRQMDESLLRFLAELGNEELKPIFLSMAAAASAVVKPGAKGVDPSRLFIVLCAMERFQDHSDGELAFIVGLLSGKEPHLVRDTAADVLGSIKHRAGVTALVSLAADPAIGETVRRSLYRLTQQDFGGDQEKWSEWFQKDGAQVELKMLSRTDWEDHLKAAPAVVAEKKAGEGSFYGLQIKGRHTLFVLDISGSMNARTEGKETRIGTLKNEMTSLLSTLQSRPTEMNFGIITFSSTFHSCFPGHGLKENSAVTRKAAQHFVDSIQANGGTAMVATMKHVMTSVLPAGDVDTIYFLSDGVPSDGGREDVLALVTQMHYQHHLKIHTIGIGEARAGAKVKNPTPSLLEEIAQRCGGTYLAK